MSKKRKLIEEKPNHFKESKLIIPKNGIINFISPGSELSKIHKIRFEVRNGVINFDCSCCEGLKKCSHLKSAIIFLTQQFVDQIIDQDNLSKVEVKQKVNELSEILSDFNI